MIELDPADPTNYFMLARLYDDAGEPAEAERMYLAARDARPNDPAVYMSLAAHYNGLGQFDKTIEALEQRAHKEPDNPEAYQTIASYYWDKANKDSRLKETEKKRLRPQGHRVGRSQRCRSSRTTRRAWSTRACSCGSRRTSKRTPPSSSS